MRNNLNINELYCRDLISDFIPDDNLENEDINNARQSDEP